MNGTPGMYLHVYQCGECKAYGTQECVWKNTKENNIACEKFEYKVPTTSFTGTTPISGFGLDLPTTMTSSCGPIIITEPSTINTEYMNAYYEKIEAPIDETTGMALYVVYYEAVRGDGRTCGSVYKPIGVYENEETAKAVVNAIEGGLI